MSYPARAEGLINMINSFVNGVNNDILRINITPGHSKLLDSAICEHLIVEPWIVVWLITVKSVLWSYIELGLNNILLSFEYIRR